MIYRWPPLFAISLRRNWWCWQLVVFVNLDNFTDPSSSLLAAPGKCIGIRNNFIKDLSQRLLKIIKKDRALIPLLL